jgi:hypothetical protein
MIEEALMINPTFKKDHLYQTKNSKLIVLCTKNYWENESSRGWEGVVIFQSSVSGDPDTRFDVGFECDHWNIQQSYWNDLGPGK